MKAFRLMWSVCLKFCSLKSSFLVFCMKTIITFLGLLFVCSVTWAQQGRYISGHITDAVDGEPIPAVAVFFYNTTVGITTDLEGNYRLSIPGEGSYNLTVSHGGISLLSKKLSRE